MKKMTDYEQAQVASIRAWMDEIPAPARETFGQAASGLADKVQKALPTSVFKMALDGAQAAAIRLSDHRSILRNTGAESLAALRAGGLERCDRGATAISRRAIGLAAGSGALFGIAGAAGLVADVPTLLIQTLRAIHRVGLCYGEEATTSVQRRLPIAIFALASANTLEEKQAALSAIRDSAQAGSEGWRQGVEQATHRALAKDAALFSINNVGKIVAKHLGWRKLAGVLPMAGAAFSGGVNAWYVHDVTRTARHVFQMRWLQLRYGDSDRVEALRWEAPAKLPRGRRPRGHRNPGI